MSKAAIRKDVVDLEALRVDYTTSGLSNRALGHKYKCTEGNIRAIAKRGGWVRTVQPGHKPLAMQLAEVVVEKIVKASDTPLMPPQEFIDAAAMQAAHVIMMHRGAAHRLYQMLETASNQLTDAMGARGLIEDLIIEDTADADLPAHPENAAFRAADARRRAAMLKAVALPAHISSVKDLTIGLKNVVEVMREAWDIDGTPPPAPPERNAPSASTARIAALREISRLRAARAG
jgi:hypothetical protein